MSAHKEPLNPLAVAKLLGPSTPTLDHLVRFLGTVRGTDKVLMVSGGNSACMHSMRPTDQPCFFCYNSLYNTGQRL